MTLDATPDNQWAPFPDRLAFDWAHYHYVRLQSSEDEIHKGLDIWRATVIKHISQHGSEPAVSDDIPWRNAKDLHATIDSIKAGALRWRTWKFRYTGAKPQTPPLWMDATYELNARDVLEVIEQQLLTTEFNGKFDYAPYEEYDHKGDRVYSNLMSAIWTNREAVLVSFFEAILFTYFTYLRTRLRLTWRRMVLCLSLSFPAATKLLFLLQQGIKSTTRYMSRQETYQTLPVVDMEML
jgi:hypothetical protein